MRKDNLINKKAIDYVERKGWGQCAVESENETLRREYGRPREYGRVDTARILVYDHLNTAMSKDTGVLVLHELDADGWLVKVS